MKVWQVEIKGKGVIPHHFATEEEARDFGLASFTPFRLLWKRVPSVAGESKRGGNLYYEEA